VARVRLAVHGLPLGRTPFEVMFCPSLPVDIRHNSKIDRPALAARAARRLRLRRVLRPIGGRR
jgi:hypothetical protein